MTINPDIEVLKYEETPETKFIGIIHVRLFKQIILRYKVVENKDGSNFFLVPPSYKRESLDGTDKWTPWFMIDSNFFSEELQDAMRGYLKGILKPKASLREVASSFSQGNQVNQSYQSNLNNQSNDNVPF